MGELRYALRVLLKNPLTTTCAVLSLALAIGANTALFSVANAILWKPLPAGVVNVYVSYPDGSAYGSGTWAEYSQYRKRSHSFEQLIAWDAKPVHITIDGHLERTVGTTISTNYFTALGLQPTRGRGLREGDENERVAVISHALWFDKFQSNPDAVGRTIQINDQSFTIIGVAPRSFWGLEADGVNLWFSGVSESARMAGRLKPAVNRAQAEAEMRLLAPEIELGGHKGATITITPGSLVTPRDATQIASLVGLMFVALGLVMAIACANVTNLLLARATGRRGEIAVRLALGAGRLRLVRQMLTESLLLALAAGFTGLLLSLWTSEIVHALQPPGDNPFAANLNPDSRVLAFTAAVSLAAALGFGLLPALQASRADVAVTLKAAGAPERSRWRIVMIAGQVAVTTVLLVSAGLLLRGFERALTLDPGFATERVLVVPFNLQLAGYDAERATAFYNQLEQSLASTPTISSASFAQIVPVGGRLQRIGITRDASDRFQLVSFNVVSAGYLRTLGLPVLAGRDFTAHDDKSAPPVALINESMARQFFAGEDPLGKSFFIDTLKLQVVGVVKDSRYLRLGEPQRPHFYRPYNQDPQTQMSLLVATTGPPAATLPLIRARVQTLAPAVPILDARTLADQVRESLFDSRNGAILAALFGGVALLLASLGLYGVISYWVSGRHREIGVRIALGAEPRMVQRMVVRQGLRPVAIGLVLGAGGSLAAGQVLQKFLYGISPTDPLTWALVALLLAVVALAAAWIPAQRAARVEPLAALRYD